VALCLCVYVRVRGLGILKKARAKSQN
jgi:hypothetical protein